MKEKLGLMILVAVFQSFSALANDVAVTCKETKDDIDDMGIYTLTVQKDGKAILDRDTPFEGTYNVQEWNKVKTVTSRDVVVYRAKGFQLKVSQADSGSESRSAELSFTQDECSDVWVPVNMNCVVHP